MGDNTYTVRILGEKGVGKTSLLALLGSLAERGGAGGAIPGGCLMRIGGAELRLLETEYSDFYGGGDRPTADMWYLAVGLDEGPMDLDIQLRGLGIPGFEAVFLNKCDAVDYDDDLIELCIIETRRCLNCAKVYNDDTVFIAGSVTDAAAGQKRAGVEAIEALLRDISSHIR